MTLNNLNELTKKESRKINIIHVKQKHAENNFFNVEDQEKHFSEVVSSQFKVAEYLINNPNIPVLEESGPRDIDCISDVDLCTYVKNNIFPSGFPKNINDLNLQQKQCLVKFGAATTLTYLGIIPKLYQSTDLEYYNQILKIMNSSSGYEWHNNFLKCMSIHEDIALSYSIKTAKVHSESQGKVIIIFGAAHDFKEKCKDLNCEVTEISTFDNTIEEVSVVGNSNIMIIMNYRLVGQNNLIVPRL